MDIEDHSVYWHRVKSVWCRETYGKRNHNHDRRHHHDRHHHHHHYRHLHLSLELSSDNLAARAQAGMEGNVDQMRKEELKKYA